jgi:hypothetical protein
METRIGSIPGSQTEPVLHRIVMDVITVATIILVVAYGVFPKAALPERLLLSFSPGVILLGCHPGVMSMLGYKRPDQPPASGIIRISLG